MSTFGTARVRSDELDIETVRRRTFLSGAGAAGAILMSRPGGVLAGSLAGGTRAQVADRASRLFPGSFLVHADMHNHTLFSDGDGDPANAFVSMRDNGLDVAALTDHAVLGGALSIPMELCGSACKSIQGMDDENWADTLTYADEAYEPETFVAIRGFEWSSPTLGHMNVWFSQDWIDPERTGGLIGLEGIDLITDEIPIVDQAAGPLAQFVRDSPIAGLAMRPFYDWLDSAPGSGLFGGGRDGIVGFNHPGREPGRFGSFLYDDALVDRVVSLEMFNRDDDYLFEGADKGQVSPLNQCLNAGWRPGILGVTDEHGTDWGGPLDKGRGGIWVDSLSRDAVRAGMERRSFFATRERGLRFDASAASQSAPGPAVRMGSDLAHTDGAVTFTIDIDKGTDWIGTPLRLQILRPGTSMPTLVREEDFVVPGPSDPLVTVSHDIALADGGWIVLRVTDPAAPSDARAAGSYAEAGRAVVYASPFYLVPAGEPAPSGSVTVERVPDAEATPTPAADGPRPGRSSGRLPVTGGTAMVGTGAAVGAAAVAAMASRRAVHDSPHDHPHPHPPTSG